MAVGKRRTAREMAIQMLYQSELGASPLPQVFASFDVAPYLAGEGGDDDEVPPPPRGRVEQDRAAFARRKRQVDEAFRYAQELVRGTEDHRGEIDAMIRAQADNWRLERMPAVDRNILRLAVYEMLFEKDIPKLVVLDEAIELAKKFGSEQSGRFVNGLLDGLLKQHTFPGSLK